MTKATVIPCPDVEMLAAWLDQGLNGPERARLTAHLADCDECRVIAANVLKFQDATPESQRAEAEQDKGQAFLTSHRSERRWGRWGAGALAAAAALLLLVQTEPEVVRRLWMTDADARLADLAQAAHGQRTVEGRLTGGFAYGPLRAPVRAGGSTAARDNWSLLGAAGKIRVEAEKSPVAANLHGLGVAALMLGEHDEAIRALEDATSEEPGSSRFQSDLAAAYLARAHASDRPDDLTRGLTASERALKADIDLVEARFNRALALEGLYLTEQAREAWHEYLEHDPGSPWADEARQHLQALPEMDTRPEQARNHSPPELTDAAIEAALDWLLQTGLPTWADAVLVGDIHTADLERRRLVRYADSISHRSGDPFAAGLVASSGTSLAVAQGTQHYGRALKALEQDDYAVAGQELLQACPTLSDPLRSLCLIETGMLASLRRDEPLAAGITLSAIAVARVRGDAYLHGRALRLVGHRFLMRGETTSGLEPYREAFAIFEKAGYLVHAGIMANQVADLLDVQGLPIEAWRWRLMSLRLAASTSDRDLAYITRVSASGLSLRRGVTEAGQVFADAIGYVDPDALPPLKRVVRERLRLRGLLSLGDLAGAKAAASRAEGVLSQSDDFRAVRVRADLLSLRASVALAAGDDRESEAALDEALAAMGPERGSQRVTAMLARATARVRRSRIPEAEADVAAAVRLLSERTEGSGGEALQLDDAPVAFEAVGSLLLAQPNLRSSRGLFLVEQLREALEGNPPAQRLRTVDAVARALGNLENDQALVYYLFADEDRLLAWVCRKDATTFHTLEIGSAEVSRLVNLLTVQLSRSVDRDDGWQKTLGVLHERLLADLPVSGTELIIIPDGVLNRVPFGALFDRASGHFLFDRHSVRMAPNLGFALGTSRANGRPANPVQNALVIGEPALMGPSAKLFDRLPRARAEATSVARLYPAATLLMGPDASKGNVISRLSAPDVLHFAGHALFALQNGYTSRLLLAGAPDDPRSAIAPSDLLGRLTGHPLRVVLAACQTAATPVDRTSGVASLAAAFLRAGASSVAATLWQVEDAASEEFFVELHRALLRGDSMPRAVGSAQRACRADAKCRRAVATWVGTSAFGGAI